MQVYVIAFYSTGERWNTVVCSGESALLRIMAQYRMDRIYGYLDSDYQEWQDKVDKSQTANVQCLTLIE